MANSKGKDKYEMLPEIATNHRLLKQIVCSDASEAEMFELFNDLKDIYENPLDKFIEDATVNRGCVYIELQSQHLN